MAEMDSDDSRPGSSASNSSADSSANSDNSRQSSPVPPESPQRSPASSHGSSSRKSRSRTSTTRSRTQSQSSSSSSENDDNNDNQQFEQHLMMQQQPNQQQQQHLQQQLQQQQFQQQQQMQQNQHNMMNHSVSSRSSSSSRESSPQSLNRREGVVSRNQSISPARKSKSSRNSSVSSNDSHRSGINMQNVRSPSNGPGENLELNNRDEPALNMSHDDFSDVSDIEADGDRLDVRSPSLAQDKSFEDDETNHADDRNDVNVNEKFEQITDLRQKLDQKKNQLKAMEEKEKREESNQIKTNGTVSEELDDLVKKHDEDALDFEAEEGECQELTKEEEQNDIEKENTDKQKAGMKESDKEVEEGEELEEGEVTDEEEKRPEETEPKPICRFYTRGQCTWGMSCRFLHPGVTDKGNYTMFDMVRPVPVPPHPGPAGGGGGGFGPHPFHDFRTERPPLHPHRPPIHPHHPHLAPHYDPRVIPPIVQDPPAAPMVESAWERGLRTAKEMMRKANKRKEQDMDFEDKKMNLTLSQDELEKDNYYIRDRVSPELSPPPYVGRHPPPPTHIDAGAYSPPPPTTKFARGPPPPYEEDMYGRSARYRELPPHRMPQYEDERRVRPAREVIVQRVEPAGRGDEWNDPWMRSKSPIVGRHDRERVEKRVRRERRSYSSNSSYSSSSTSPSGSSSESSRSPSPETRRRHYNSTHSSSHKSPTFRRHIKAGVRSPSPRRRHSPSIRRSPIGRKRHMSPSPLSDKRVPLSPIMRRKKISPPGRKTSFEKGRKRRRATAGSSSSGSESSDSSGSDSESSYSSSSGTSSRGNTPVKRPPKILEKSDRKLIKKLEPQSSSSKKRSPISIEIKKQSSIGTSALNSESNSMSSTISSSKVKTARREELLKQLRAVEDAIARKRQKLN